MLIAAALPFKILQLHRQSYYFAYQKTIEVPRMRIATALPFKILQLHMQSYYFAYQKTIEVPSIELSIYNVTSVQG